MIVEFGQAIPATGHDYSAEMADAGAHYCKSCGHGEEHLFRTTEYEKEVLCTCVICEYHARFDVNSREKISQLPRIVVSDAYALNGQNEVVVYLELYSSVGITSAYFSVYFGDELELVSYSYGNILYKPSAAAFKEYSDHLNVSLAQANSEVSNSDYKASNTLLKLVFRTPENAVAGTEYPILVVNKAVNSNGETKFVDKFTSSTGEPLDFIALNGKIKVVDRLPGDVVGDGSIDLLDAVILSKYSVLEGTESVSFLSEMKQQYENFDIAFGDVTLDNAYTNADVVQILRYIVGGYEARILAKEFFIKLNYNDDTGREETISARYDENGKIVLENLPLDLQRDGFKFDGWFYGFGQDAKKLDGNYLWNYDAIEQTLYAHYTLNHIAFDGNGATSDGMSSISYKDTDQWNVSNSLEKISYIYFDSNCFDCESIPLTVTHTFLGWSLVPNGEIVYKLGDVIDLKSGNIGSITLYAVWSTEVVDLPAMNRHGYLLGAWTTDKVGFNVIGAVNDSYSVTGDTTLYAKWSLISYSIVYDGNGATDGSTVDSTVHSALTQFPLVPNAYVRQGYRFNGWNTKSDGSGIAYADKAIVSYIPSESNGVVTLYAQWIPNTYEIVFNKNADKLGTEPTGTMVSLPAVYDQEQTLPMNVYSVNGWIFKGWAMSPDGEVMYEDMAVVKNVISAHEMKANLYAVWAVDPYTIGKYVNNGAVVADTDGSNSYTVYNNISETPQLCVKGKVVVDWTSCEARTYNYITEVNSTGTRYGGGNNNLDIAFGVTEVYFIGNPQAVYTEVYMYTVGYPVDSALTIHLKDMNLSSLGATINSWYDVKAQDVGMYLTIDCQGKNTLTATGDGQDVIVNRIHLKIVGSGDLTVQAGHGADATTAGEAGHGGGTAIIADYITVDMTGTLTVMGGHGGAGAKGNSQQNGGNGGNGGAAIWCKQMTMSDTSIVTLVGGNGGNGAQGGQGYKGAQGKTGNSATENGAGAFSGTVNASNGGPGYQGGTGASGGTGGNGAPALIAEEFFHNQSEFVTMTGGDGGKGGKGGTGGTGGKGGTGGADDCGAIFSYNAPGNGGKGGKGGTGGIGGTGGNKGKAFNTAVFEGVDVIATDGTLGGGGEAGDGGSGGSGGDGGAGGANGSDGSSGGPGDPGDPGTPGGTYSG